MSPRFSRRRLLASSTVAAVGALPFVRHLTPVAHAATGAKFCFIFYHPFGVVTNEWYPDTFGRNFQLKKCSAPLEEIRDDIILFRNMDNAMGMKNECKNGKDQHAGPVASLYAGFDMEGADGIDRGPGGPSFDSLLARHFHPNLHHDEVVTNLGVRSDEHKTNWKLLKKTDGATVVSEVDPRVAFAAIFGAGGAGKKPDAPMEKPFTALKDALRADLNLFETALALPERERFQQYMESFAAFEQGGLQASGPLADCAVPDVDSFMAPLVDGHRQEDIIPIAQRQIELGIMALSCGARRIATLQLTGGFTNFLVRPGPNPDTETVHGHLLSHGTNKKGDTEKLKENLSFHQASLFTELIKGLKQAANPLGGGSLFDDTIVLWGSEMSGNGGGGHSKLRVPYTVAAGKNCGFKTGRHVDANFGTTQMVMRTVATAFGMPDEPIGSPEFCPEQLGGLYEEADVSGNYDRNVMQYKDLTGRCQGHKDGP